MWSCLLEPRDWIVELVFALAERGLECRPQALGCRYQLIGREYVHLAGSDCCIERTADIDALRGPFIEGRLGVDRHCRPIAWLDGDSVGGRSTRSLSLLHRHDRILVLAFVEIGLVD